jgi:tetratricopeptide (TPR) repeat protein
LDSTFPTAWRNLALYYYNKEKNQKKAIEYMESAFRLDETDARILMELDQLYKVTGISHATRLAFLGKYVSLIDLRDDLVLEYVTLLNMLGRYEEAKQMLDSRIFHPWEGGEGKVPAQYQYARVEMAKIALAEEKSQKAIALLEECLEYPCHLGEGKLYGAQENDFYYFLGCAYDLQGDHDKACECWEKAALGSQEPAAAIYYNDAKPEKIFYQGLALQKLGCEEEAHSRFYKLVNYGKQHIFEKQTMDYFAVSLPDLQIWDGDLDVKNRIHCLFMLALGYTGLGDSRRAEQYLHEVKKMDVNHQGIKSLCSFLNNNL